MRLLLFIVFLLITLFSNDVFVRWPRIFFYLTSVFPTFRSIPLRTSHHCCKEEDLDFAIYSVFEDVTLAFQRQPCRLTRTKCFSPLGTKLFFISCFVHQHGHLVMWLQTKNRLFSSCPKPQFQSEAKCVNRTHFFILALSLGRLVVESFWNLELA